MTTVEALEWLRGKLSTPRANVRIVGLSGVGKTRFVQALFEPDDSGDAPLGKHVAIYGDAGGHLEPGPEALAEQLVAKKHRAVLIVDNCGSDVHRRLVDRCSRPGSKISLVTVEYDVREDLPESTNVVRFGAAEEKLVEVLLQRRHPELGPVDIRRLAGLSGGNARVALVLAAAVPGGKTLTDFRDEELFERLFWQRNELDGDLLAAAKACALFYSFKVDDDAADTSELHVLAGLAEQSTRALYARVEQLRKRQLVQARGPWRAVLPDAIANRLAKEALSETPRADLWHALFMGDNPRLPRLVESFSRRMGHLHESERAREIVLAWLDPAGWLGSSLHELSELQMRVLENIAPVVPEAAVQALQRTMAGPFARKCVSPDNPHRADLLRLVQRIAYDPDLFTPCMDILVSFALPVGDAPRGIFQGDPLDQVFGPLFQRNLSGTHASPELRARFIETLLMSGDERRHEIGAYLLGHALNTGPFSAPGDFSFGARSRDFGYYPRSGVAVKEWYELFLKRAERVALEGSRDASTAVRQTLADNFYRLFLRTPSQETLTRLAVRLHEAEPWFAGWRAVKKLLWDQRGSISESPREKLTGLESSLRPTHLKDQIEAVIINVESGFIDLDPEPHADRFQSAVDTAICLGRRLMGKPRLFEKMLPRLLAMENNGLIAERLGWGVGRHSDDKVSVFEMIMDAARGMDLKGREHLRFVVGFFAAASENDLTFREWALDKVTEKEVLARLLPLFLAATPSAERDLHRLQDYIVHRRGPLAAVSLSASVGKPSDETLADLIEALLAVDGGLSHAVSMLGEHLAGRRYNMSTVDPLSAKLQHIGQATLEVYVGTRRLKPTGKEDFHLALIAETCLSDPSAEAVATRIMTGFVDTFADHRAYAFEFGNLLAAFARAQPLLFLDVFVGNENLTVAQVSWFFSDANDFVPDPTEFIVDNTLFAWADEHPVERYLRLAHVMRPLGKREPGLPPRWPERALRVLANVQGTHRRSVILEEWSHPVSWVGSYADALEASAEALEQLRDYENDDVRLAAQRVLDVLQPRIATEREHEATLERKRLERFE